LSAGRGARRRPGREPDLLWRGRNDIFPNDRVDRHESEYSAGYWPDAAVCKLWRLVAADNADRHWAGGKRRDAPPHSGAGVAASSEQRKAATNTFSASRSFPIVIASSYPQGELHGQSCVRQPVRLCVLGRSPLHGLRRCAHRGAVPAAHRLFAGRDQRAPGPLAGRRILVDSLLADGRAGFLPGRGLFLVARAAPREASRGRARNPRLSRHADARRTPAARQAGFLGRRRGTDRGVAGAASDRQPQHRSPRAGDGDHAHAVRRADVWAGLPELFGWKHLITRTVAHIGHLKYYVAGLRYLIRP